MESCERLKRKIQLCLAGHTRGGVRFLTRKGVFVSGALHWLVYCRGFRYTMCIDILTFDVSTESYGKVAMPPLPESFRQSSWPPNQLDVCVLRGRLGVFLDYCKSFVVWVMEGDGTWKKDLAIDCTNIQLCHSFVKPFYFCDANESSYSFLKPFYFYDVDGNVVKAVTSTIPVNNRKLFIYKEEQDGSSTLVEKSFGSKGYGILC